MDLKDPVIYFGRPDWLTAASLHLLWGETGIGKSFVATVLAVALCAGYPVLGFTCPAPRSVLYVDGEMARPMVRKRINWLLKGHEFTQPQRDLVDANLYLYDWEEFRDRGLDIGKTSGQRRISELANSLGPVDDLVNGGTLGTDVIILDNLSCLMQVEDDNSATSWNPMTPWLASERNCGRTILILHHAGKDPRKQRGTSRREDILDTSIGLVRPRVKRGDQVDEIEDEAGIPEDARRDTIWWHWKKTRSFAKPPPFQVNLETCEALRAARVTCGTDAEVERAEEEQTLEVAIRVVRNRVTEGLPPDFRGVAERFGVSKSTLERRYKEQTNST